MSEKTYPTITVIGTGSVGATLALALKDAGYAIRGVYNRTTTRANEISSEVGALYAGEFPQDKIELGDVNFICVPDDEIENIGRRIKGKFSEVKNLIFAHCSGVKPASVLHHLNETGAFIAAFQPVQTFLRDYHKNSFSNVPVSLQGDQSALEVLQKIANNLGAKPFFISEHDKILLHVAAVFACNYMTTIAEAARVILASSQIGDNDPLSLLHPLMEQTLNNIETKGPAASLSGPIKRADWSTIESHLNSLNEFPDLKILYGALGKNTVNMFSDHLNPDQTIIQKVATLLSGVEKD